MIDPTKLLPKKDMLLRQKEMPKIDREENQSLAERSGNAQSRSHSCAVVLIIRTEDDTLFRPLPCSFCARVVARNDSQM